MNVDLKKKLYLTREEQETITKLYKILDSDNELTLNNVWDLLTNIACMYYEDKTFLSTDYNYDVEITD